MFKKPKPADIDKPKVVNGKQYWWCPKQKFFTRHKESKCRGVGSGRETQNQGSSDSNQTPASNTDQQAQLRISNGLTSIAEKIEGATQGLCSHCADTTYHYLVIHGHAVVLCGVRPDFVCWTARLDLIGDFQADNVAVAMGLVIACGAPADDVITALAALETVRGRMQLAARRDNGAAVFVDYAHTPDAVATALRAMRPHVLGRLIAVIGAGGDRDRTKRPLMGAAAAAAADTVFVTDDNPRSEDPETIRAAVMQGCREGIEVADRAEAILRAVDALEPGDALLIAGKGHETGQIVGDDVLPFDDAEQASIAVAALEGRLT